jgi:outer membrane protein, heavy metal efflux system
LLMNPSRPAVALAGAIVMLAGCQSYQPKPLDLASHRDMWSARMPGDEPVRAFAERLAASGQPSVFDPSDGLSLAEGELVALVYNPDLRLARLRAGISAATADHAGLWDDPQLTVDFLQVTESIPNPYFITPGLAFTIPISGRLDAEKERADAVLAAELTRVAEVEWAVRIEVRQTWLRWSAAKMRAEQTEQLLASIESLVGSTSRLAEAGEMLQTEAALFTIERASQSRVLLKFRGDAAEGEQRLRSLLGVSPDAPLELQSTLVATTDFDQPTAGAAAERNLTLVRLRDEYEVAERTLYREVRKQYPDLTIGPLADFDQGQTMLGFSLALPIPILNANKQGIAQAIAERELARAAFETEYDRLVGSLAATQVRIETLREQRNLIESEIAPLVDRQLGDAQRLLGLGEGEGLILLESLSRVGQTRMELIETRLAESLAESELSHLLGPPAPSIETSENPTDQNATTAGHAGSRLPKVTP